MCLTFFFFNDTATTEIYTLSLHDALPILKFPEHSKESPQFSGSCQLNGHDLPGFAIGVLRNEEGAAILQALSAWRIDEKQRSEEHTSELQSQSNLVCRLLLETKNTSSSCH